MCVCVCVVWCGVVCVVGVCSVVCVVGVCSVVCVVGVFVCCECVVFACVCKYMRT